MKNVHKNAFWTWTHVSLYQEISVLLHYVKNWSSQARNVYPVPNDENFLCPWGKSLLKKIRESERMLVTSIFSSFHNVFYSIKNNIYNFDLLFLRSLGLGKLKILLCGKC